MIDARAVGVVPVGFATEGVEGRESGWAAGGHLPEQPWDGLISLRSLARRLRTLRLRSGWTIEEVADRADVSRSTVYQLERGGTPRPRGQTLHRLAEAYGVSIDDLLFQHGQHSGWNHTRKSGGPRVAAGQPDEERAEERRGGSARAGHGPGVEQPRSRGRWAGGATPGADLDSPALDLPTGDPLTGDSPTGDSLTGDSPTGDSPALAGLRSISASGLELLSEAWRGVAEQALELRPELFADWSATDWGEFATQMLTEVSAEPSPWPRPSEAGQLGTAQLGTGQEFVERARNWQAVRQLRRVLATPLAGLAIRLIAELHASANEQAPVNEQAPSDVWPS